MAKGFVHALSPTRASIVETGGYRMAWIGLAEEDVRRQVRPVAWAGKGHGYISKAKVVWSSMPHGRGPTGVTPQHRLSTIPGTSCYGPTPQTQRGTEFRLTPAGRFEIM